MRRHRTWRLIRIQTVCYSDSGLRKKIEENANFRNSADDILADDKLPSMQRVNSLFEKIGNVIVSDYNTGHSFIFKNISKFLL